MASHSICSEEGAPRNPISLRLQFAISKGNAFNEVDWKIEPHCAAEGDGHCTENGPNAIPYEVDAPKKG
jgi:hypothetical protein